MIRRAFDEFESRAATLGEAVAHHAGATASETDRAVSSLQGELARLESLARLRVAFEPIRPLVQSGPVPRTSLVVGFASSMEKVLPRGAPISATATNRVQVTLARNEKESFQVLVLPCEGPLREVRVRVGSLRSASGAEFLSTNVSPVPVVAPHHINEESKTRDRRGCFIIFRSWFSTKRTCWPMGRRNTLPRRRSRGELQLTGKIRASLRFCSPTHWTPPGRAAVAAAVPGCQ
ncbi:MAG: hypothetical protein ABSF95_03755 [Verrucomicrobiota bacterium]